MNVNHSEAWQKLNEADNILLLTHRCPDGDAVGSIFALYRVLRRLGKNVRCETDPISGALRMAVADGAYSDFQPDYIVSVDLADEKLLPDNEYPYYGQIDLCIDHHVTNSGFAKYTLVDSEASAACEVLCDMLSAAGFEPDAETAAALYMGVATDTGCFCYPNTTAKTLEAAAALIKLGAPNGEINRLIFQTKTRAYVQFETMAMNSVRFYLDGKCAIMILTKSMFQRTGVTEGETHGIAALPRQIEGVMAGIVIKERQDGSYKLSVRTNDPLSAADICAVMGGGGHRLAAGCDIRASINTVINTVVAAVKDEMKSCGLCGENT